MEGIQVSMEKVGANQDIAVIKVGGYIDTTTSAELEHSLSSIMKSNCFNIVIDLGNVDYISSAGWGIFISEIKGIREKHGDLKLVRMIPDVYEVFELLEFHYILKAFDNIEEAIADFDHVVATSATLQAPVNNEPNSKETTQFAQQTEATVTQIEKTGDSVTSGSGFETIEEKLKQAIVEKPDASTHQIGKVLNTPRFGNLKLGYFELRKYLKKLNLASKKKRIAYFKQRTFS